jgi:hypothetical protein
MAGLYSEVSCLGVHLKAQSQKGVGVGDRSTALAGQRAAILLQEEPGRRRSPQQGTVLQWRA